MAVKTAVDVKHGFEYLLEKIVVTGHVRNMYLEKISFDVCAEHYMSALEWADERRDRDLVEFVSVEDDHVIWSSMASTGLSDMFAHFREVKPSQGFAGCWFCNGRS